MHPSANTTDDMASQLIEEFDSIPFPQKAVLFEAAAKAISSL
jgi:hypothetical protein